MIRRRVLRATAVVCVLAAGWLVSPLIAGADEPVETGWWSRENGGNPVGPPITVPRPPDVPEGGLLVANDVAGPAAISALRFRATVATSSTLTLVATDPFSALNPPEIVACVQASGWGATDHGEWFSAPDAGCETASVAGTVGEESITWRLSAAFKRGDRPFIEVVLVPGEDATPFRVSFEAPGADALTAPVDLATPTTTTPPVPPPAIATPTTEPVKQFGGPQVAAASPPSTSSPPTTAPPVQATPPPQDEVASGPVTPASATDTAGERILAAVLLGVLGLSLWAASGDRERMMGLLAAVPVVGGRVRGSDDEERVGGVGRFSRPREDPPTRL